MKTMFIPAFRKSESYNIKEIERIPGKLHILYSIQYRPLAEQIKKQLGKKVSAFEQVLGCSKIKPKATLLLIGSGRFHALQLAYSTGKEVLVYDSGKFDKINKEEIEVFNKKEQGKLAKFYASDSIGMIVSTKPGQNNLNQAIKLKNQLAKKYTGKKFYIYIAETINLLDLENFPVDIFINFACPGLSLDSNKIINYEKIKK